MQGTSRESLAAARERLAALRAELPEAAGLGQVAEALDAVVRLLDREGRLRRALAEPATAPEAKQGLLRQLLGEQLPPLAMRLLEDVVALRWATSGDLVDAIEDLAATALFLVAEADGDLDQVEDELFRLARVVEREPQLRAVLVDRSIEDDRKTALLDDLLGDRVRPATRTAVRSAVLHPRGRTLEGVLEHRASLAAGVRSRRVAHVVSAIPLDEAQRQRLTGALARQFGQAVQLQVEVDPSVLGGLSVRVGDEALDGTTLRRLGEARRRLVGTAG